ncbi:helix-turn-helix domain-containing protein [Methylobacterium brachiatum]|uniref:helix-turn-helix domain-containing protein n=1 Tax=Methylobacterium brachiatum TaxID=269660 RepID=UPI002447DE1D|nr:helix-turn-helix domain-containing protein [Methylobacterium brachiatum]MDH2313087.1 helix-turn-helix domain-containing protein [Methylobacterium brachiatum]
MLRQGTPAREFTDAAGLQAHYRALRERLWAPRPVQPRHADGRTRALSEAQRERELREEEERRRAVFEARAEMDALVFQVLDPEQLAREPKRIIMRVAEAFGVTHADIVGESKTARVVQARWAAIAAVREAWPNKSLPQLGRCFGGRDHTTIMHAIRTMERTGVPQPPTGRPAR